MSKSVNRRHNESSKIHSVGRKHPEREIDRILTSINKSEDLENIDLDEFLNTTHTKIQK